jgi:hypothetical protein
MLSSDLCFIPIFLPRGLGLSGFAQLDELKNENVKGKGG